MIELTKITAQENSSVPVAEKYIPQLKEIKEQNPDLAFEIKGNNVHFSNYTIGEIQVADLIISIEPRNPAFVLKDFFEMLVYIDYDFVIPNLKSLSYNLAKTNFSLANITDYFCQICFKLLQYGLTGAFINENNYSMTVRGKIDFNSFNFPLLPVRGAKISYNKMTINTPANQIIKAALLKLFTAETDERNLANLSTILKEFDSIGELNSNVISDRDIIYKNFSSNPFYPVALDVAIKILKDFKLSFQDGKLKWYAFLQNSNDVFEKYVRKVLANGLKEKVIKWEKPKKFASITYNTQTGFKYYSPDIIVDFNEHDMSCRAILDAKNKTFEPDPQTISDLTSTGDIYQLLLLPTPKV
jgi:5-methylcytosine-specific restriction endonuclease McrBC regulatory subunit McrC